MSLPIPSSSSSAAASSSPTLDPKVLQQMDAPLIALTQQCGGDLRRLMFAFFSFLHRRTDFYLVPPQHDEDDDNYPSGSSSSKMGFKEGDAEKLLIAAFRQFPLRRIPKQQQQQSGSGPASKGTTIAQSQTKKKTPSTTTTPSPGKQEKEISSGSSKETEESKTAATEKKKGEAASKNTTTTTTTSTKANQTGNMVDVKYNEEGLQIPIGNGGSTPRYKWTQTIDETSVLIGVPESLRGKDLDVKITPSTLTVQTKKKPMAAAGDQDQKKQPPMVFVDGKLFGKVRVDESTWSMEGGVVIVTLDKVSKTYWKNVIHGDEQIDTDLVDSRRHISEYDNATQGQIRKCIFDQTQYHKGLPSSDEILGAPGASNKIPPLPTGVEYIDKKKLDEEDAKKKKKESSGGGGGGGGGEGSS